MKTRVEEFRKLHFDQSPLLLGNVWNVKSALQYEKLGFRSIGTSSAAIASDLGYEDGENMPFDEYFFIIKKIAYATKLPLTVDLEAGYGNTADEIIVNIVKLHEIGVVGVNIEDSIVNNAIREIVDADEFTIKVKVIIEGLVKRNIPMFINVRCDAFLLDLPNALEEAKQRIKRYEILNIDGVFLPCVTDENDIKEIAMLTKLPLNVMCMPNLPNFETLKKLGVQRISMGNFANVYLNNQLDKLMTKAMDENRFTSIFES